jgi:hypothetical protein
MLADLCRLFEVTWSQKRNVSKIVGLKILNKNGGTGYKNVTSQMQCVLF